MDIFKGGGNMSFRDREKKRLVPIKTQLFSNNACQPGKYRGKVYNFCLDNNCSRENLHESIRNAAIRYFKDRNIKWHDGIGGDQPSNHLCCSQSFCVNTWFPYTKKPKLLKHVLLALGYPVEQVLPFTADQKVSDSDHSYVVFEWIGEKNYLGEHRAGKVAGDEGRNRGQGFTSADFAFRFKRLDGKVQIVLGEWKYTETYSNKRSIKCSGKTDRLEIYKPELQKDDCPINLGTIPFGALFYDPFDQLMRLQLLAKAMERNKEMGVDIVSVLHIAPKANRGLINRITPPQLASLGKDIHEVWGKIVNQNNFRGAYAEDLIDIVTKNAPDNKWGAYMNTRYRSMK